MDRVIKCAVCGKTIKKAPFAFRGQTNDYVCGKCLKKSKKEKQHETRS